MEELRQADVYRIRPQRTFRQAAVKYLNQTTKVTISDDDLHLKLLVPLLGKMALESVHKGTLVHFIEARKAQGFKSRTINYAIQTVRRILNLTADEWFDEDGMAWLAKAPKISHLSESERREPYPLSWEE